MERKDFKSKLINATKWSAITEVVCKLVYPISNMILARLISKEAFGVVATINMVMSFADMFTDAGFQKYLVQHEFKNETEKNQNANVAFWTNFSISVFLWINIILFREPIAKLVGNPGMGNVIAIACFQLLLTSFSSIQMALYRRSFDFKTLFVIRIVGVLIPIFVTIPLAYLGFSYWALIIGGILSQLYNAIILTVKSKWKPKLFYSFSILKEMFSFSLWSLIEAITIWIATWIDVFIISNYLSQYHLGLYKTSISMVNSIMTIITATIIPIFFSSMSRLQNNNDKFKKMYFDTQRYLSYILFPMGIGMFLYRDLLTEILLGKSWINASGIVGIWALVKSLVIVMGNLSSEVYRAKGNPKLSILSQVIYLALFIPSCIYSIRYGFEYFIITRASLMVGSILIDLVIMNIFVGISSIKVLKNVNQSAICTIIMGIIVSLMLNLNNGLLFRILVIIIAIIIYSLLLLAFKNARNDVLNILNIINIKNKKLRMEG